MVSRPPVVTTRAITARHLKAPLLRASLAAALLLIGAAWQTSRAEPAGAACLAAAAVSADAPGAESADATAIAPQPAIQVTVENVRSSKGLITAVLYSDNPDTFLKRGARLDRIRVEAQEGETVLCLHAPAQGRYSVALYHDENGNKEFDRDFLGIPTEGYGFSQNPGFRFGKPGIEETLFLIDGGSTSLRVSLLYLSG
ncbi:MAG: hypothetical protein Tsb0032_02780 [Kiloniellaceae bacterium]